MSRELQRFDLELWRGEAVSAALAAGGSHASSVPSPSSSSEEPSKRTSPASVAGSTGAVDYVHNQYGLFPLPCSRSLKAGPLAKIRSKFRFVGKFIAKAIMDSRMVYNISYHEAFSERNSNEIICFVLDVVGLVVQSRVFPLVARSRELSDRFGYGAAGSYFSPNVQIADACR